MNFQNTLVLKTDSIILGEFTAMESRCVASQERLKPGDRVVVVYLTQVGPGVTVPLEIPFIVKADKFQGYIDRLIQMIEADTMVTSVVSPLQIVSPVSETAAVVKTDSPTSEKPAEPTA